MAGKGPQRHHSSIYSIPNHSKLAASVKPLRHPTPMRMSSSHTSTCSHDCVCVRDSTLYRFIFCMQDPCSRWKTNKHANWQKQMMARVANAHTIRQQTQNKNFKKTNLNPRTARQKYQHPAVNGSTAGVAIIPCVIRANGGLFKSHCPSTPRPCTLPALLPPKPPHKPPCANSGVICSCRKPLIPAMAAMQLPPLSAAAAAAAAAMLHARITLLRRSADREPAWQEPSMSRPGGEHRNWPSCCCCWWW